MLVTRNSSLKISVRVVDPSLVMITDLSHLTEITFLVKPSIDSLVPTILKKLTDVSTHITVNTGTGVVTVSLSQADTNITPGDYIWGMSLRYDNGNSYELVTKENSFLDTTFTVHQEIVSYTEG